MELCVITDEISRDFAHACKVAREHGATAVEVRRVGERRPHDLDNDNWREMRTVLRDSHLRVCCIASAFGKADPADRAEVAQQLDILRRSADTARELDCPLIRGFAFHNPYQGPKQWDHARRAYDRVPEILEEWNVTLAVENEPGTYVETAEDATIFLGYFRLPYLKATWDPANHYRATLGNPSALDATQHLREHVAHVHVKDIGKSGGEEFEARYLGRGAVGWSELIAYLRESNYDGCLSLETQVGIARLPQDLRDTYRELFNREAERETASRISLELLRDLLAGGA